MAKANQKDIPALFIRTKHDGVYRRAGFKFNRQGYGIALSALDKDQVKLLKADPHLRVEECTFPADELVDDDAAKAEATRAAAEKAEAERVAAEKAAAEKSK